LTIKKEGFSNVYGALRTDKRDTQRAYGIVINHAPRALARDPWYFLHEKVVFKPFLGAKRAIFPPLGGFLAL
jgi:hypothetical protein